MNSGEAPEETAELTTFVMDCTPYGAQKPQNVSVASTTYNSVTITFVSETNTGEVVYSTEADFDPSTATPISVDFTALPASEDPWGGTPPNSSLTLTGLESLTNYYVSVRSTNSRMALTEHEPRPSIAVQRNSHGVVVAMSRATISTTASRPLAILLPPATSRPLAVARVQASRVAVGVKGYRALTATIPSAIHSSWQTFLLAAASVSRLAMARRQAVL